MAGSGKTTLMAQLQKSLNLRDDGDGDDVSFVEMGVAVHLIFIYNILCYHELMAVCFMMWQS